MGAIASGGVVVINDDVVRGLGIAPEAIEQVAEREGRELLRREQAYREGRPFPEVAGKVVIVVDDGLATGSSMRAGDRGAAEAAARPDRGRRAGRAGVHLPGARCAGRRSGLRDNAVAVLRGRGAPTGISPRRPTKRSGTSFARSPGSRPAAGSAPGPTEVAVIRAEAVPVEEGTPGRRGAVRSGRRRASGADRRGLPRHQRVLRGAGADDAQADRGAEDSARSPPRRTGPMPTG